MSETPGRPQSEFQSEDIDFDWRDLASCRTTENVNFFPDPSDEKALREARAVCAGCLVVEECLEYALEMNQQQGVWGGKGEQERRKIRRKWLANQRRDRE